MARRRTPDVMAEALGEKTEPAPKKPSRSRRRSTAAATAPETVQTPAAPSSPVAAIADRREAVVTATIHRYAIWSAGVSVIPLPVLDTIALTGLQVKMLSALASAYGVDFSATAGRAMIASLLSAGGAQGLSGSLLMRMIRGVPVAGWIAGWLVMPAAAGGLTYAVGRVFAQHFASGGSILGFDATGMGDSLREEYRRGVAFVRGKRQED